MRLGATDGGGLLARGVALGFHGFFGWGAEEALAVAAGLSELADLGFFFGVGGIGPTFAFVFERGEAAVVWLGDEIGVEVLGGCWEPECEIGSGGKVNLVMLDY